MSSIYLLVPKGKEAKAWVKKYVCYEPYQVMGDSIEDGIAIGHRYIEEIAEAMTQEGLDFEVLS